MIGKWHLGSDPVGFDRLGDPAGPGRLHDPVFYTATGEKTYTGRYVTDVITDLAIDFIENRPRDKPFFLMCTTRRRIARGSRTRRTARTSPISGSPSR